MQCSFRALCRKNGPVSEVGLGLSLFQVSRSIPPASTMQPMQNRESAFDLTRNTVTDHRIANPPEHADLLRVQGLQIQIRSLRPYLLLLQFRRALPSFL